MSSLSDHVRRDAEHALRSKIRVDIMRYVRRMDELGKSYIKEAIEEATNSGEAIDGTELGETAASQALRTYIGTGEPQPAIESTTSETS